MMLTVFLYALGFVALLILTQDLQIFPGAALSKLYFLSQRKKPVPAGTESIFIDTPDGQRLEVWRYEPPEVDPANRYIAVLFHGNGGPVENFFFAQICLGELGITTYSFDYRGFGRSSGWPSEAGMKIDSDAVWDYVLGREKVDGSRLIAVGISIGSSLAARIAARRHPRILLLTSPFVDLKSVIRAQPLLRYLAPFSKYSFSTERSIKKLVSTHMLIAHGEQDTIVPVAHAKRIQAAYRGNGSVVLHISPEAGHNAAFYALKEEIKETLRGWM